LLKTTNIGLFRIMLMFLVILTSSIHSSDLLSVKFVNNEVGYISGKNGYLSKTTDGGSAWNIIETNSAYDMWDVCLLGENSIITACSNGKILKTTDGGISWESMLEGVNDNFKNIFLTYDSRLIICGENSNLFISNDYGESWERIIIPVNSNLNKIFFLDGTYGYIVGSNGTLLASTDGGVTWTLKMSGDYRINLTSISMADDKIGTITGESGLILNTINGWNTWKVYAAPSGNQNIYEVKYINSTDAIASGGNFILKTTNNGRSWIFSEIPHIISRGTLNSIYFPSLAKGFIVGSNGIKLMTTNQGETWVYVEASNEDNDISSMRVQNSSNNIIIQQNYPNPFNPSTVISYSLPIDSFVKLKVYDISGREISLLVNEYKTAGSYNVQFNASGLSSGMYFYSITSVNEHNTSVKTMKMLLIK
jgi:photosystem II stability/assembly factor-like uncharacterized protein